MIRIADPHGRRAHDAYHRFLRAGVWSMARPTLAHPCLRQAFWKKSIIGPEGGLLTASRTVAAAEVPAVGAIFVTVVSTPAP
jgi:hypothetical protein